MKPLFAAAVAAPWGSSKGLITSKAYTHLAHAVISPRSTRKNCSRIVLGVGDAPVPGSLQANVADGIGNTMKEWTKHATFLPKKSCKLRSGFRGTGFSSRVSAELSQAGRLLVPLWNQEKTGRGKPLV